MLGNEGELNTLEEMSVKELKELASTNGIDIKGLKKKADIVSAIETYLNINKENSDTQEGNTKIEEEVKMEENSNVNVNVDEEMQTPTGEVNTEIPVSDGDKKEKDSWKLQDGTIGSKSAFIREQFTVLNKTRKAISEEFEIPYRTVYGATLNMTNDAEGNSPTAHTLMVDEASHPYVEKDGKFYLDGVEIEAADAELIKPTLIESDRDEWIRAQVEAGVKRSDLADKLKTSYGVVYGATKDLGTTRQKHEVEYEGKMIPRNDYIRMQFAKGVTKADIAKELDVDYSVVWSATKEEKTAAEKFQDQMVKIEKFASDVVDVDSFNTLVNALKLVEFKKAETAEEAKVAEEAETAEPADTAEATATTDAE